MSAEALDWVWGMYPVYQGRPDTLAKHMLLFAAARADARGESFWGEERFRRELCAGRDAFRVRKALLVEAGYVVIETRRHTQGPRRGQRTSDLWKLQLATRLPDEPPCVDQPDGFWAGPQTEGPLPDAAAGGTAERSGSTPARPEPTKPRSARRRPNSGPPVEEEQAHKNQGTRRTRVTSGDHGPAPAGPDRGRGTPSPDRSAGQTTLDEEPTRERRRPTRRTRLDDHKPAVA